MTDLAVRAVACPGWRWKEGAGGVDSFGRRFRVVEVDDDGTVWAAQTSRCTVAPMPTGCRPVFDDATLGCLLALVREAWGRDDITTRKAGRGPSSRWQVDCVGTPDELLEVAGATEAEALVAALEAAGRREVAGG